MQQPPTLSGHPLYRIAARLRPRLRALDGDQRLTAFAEVLAVLYMAPIALLSLLWLTVATGGRDFIANLVPLAWLALVLLIVDQQTTDLEIELDREPLRLLRISGSLSSLILWAGLLCWGPVMIWSELVAGFLLRIRESWRRARFDQDVIWFPVAGFAQDVGSLVPGSLLGLIAYRALGGAIPFDTADLAGWMPPLVAILIASLIPGVLILPLIVQISHLAGSAMTPSALRSFMVSMMVLVLVPAPFAILLSLLYTHAGWEAFILALIGVALVNLLAHSLSRSNDRSQQQSREMTQLEKLGEAILRASPDGSTLMEILQKQIAATFVSPLDRVEIRLFDPLHLPGLAVKEQEFHLLRPSGARPLPDPAWQELQQWGSPYRVLQNEVPAGMQETYGDAILVKILSAAPLSGQAAPDCIGGIYLLRHKDEARAIDSLPTVQALASQIASAIYRAQVHQEALTAAKMSQELTFAGRIQASFLPEALPSIPGWSLAASLIPARQTSGDFYDFLSLPDGRLGLLIADVADKGTGAALYMALSRTLLRTFALQYPERPAEVLRQANERLLADSRADQFVTLFYAVLDPTSGSLTYCNAGHNPPLLLRGPAPRAAEPLPRTGMALGVMEGQAWHAQTVLLQCEDVLLLYTDGATEAQNAADEFFGEQRLEAAARAQLDRPAEAIHTEIRDAIRHFAGDAPQFDDITLMVIKREDQ